MPDLERKLWKYILNAGIYAGVGLSLAEACVRIRVLKVDWVSFLFYYVAVFFAGMLIELFGRKAYLAALLPVFAVAVWLPSRDTELLLNVLAACIFYYLSTVVVRFRKHVTVMIPVTVGVLVMLHGIGEVPAYVACGAAFLTVYTWMRLGRMRHANQSVLLLAVAIVACLIPSSPEPMKWEHVKKAVGYVKDAAVNGWKNIDYFFDGVAGKDGTTYVGYSESGQLGGAVHDKSREALYFDATGRDMNCYLRGAEYHAMSPEGFLTRDPMATPINGWMALYLSGLSKSGITKEEAKTFSKAEHGSITYAYIRTQDLLLPSTVFQIRNDLRNGLSEREKKGFSYDFNYLAIDYGSPYLWETMEKASGVEGYASYEEAARAASDLYNLRLGEYLSEEEYEVALEESAAVLVDPTYLDTSMATDRIVAKTAEITADAETQMEKALAIENYLRSYPYDTEVDLRGADNYVDDFLFETQRGYCMHYASAMVLMLRVCGIPSRYVQGYLYKPENEGVVYGGNAHAWVEAYMPDFGWVRFEPTGAETGTIDGSWGAKVTASGTGKPGVAPPAASTQYKPDTKMVLTFDGEETVEKKHSALELVLMIGRYFLLVLAIFTGAVLVFFGAERIRYMRLSEEEKLSEEIGRLKKRLGKGLPEGVQIASVFDFLPYVAPELQGELEELLWGYYRVRFRGDEAEADLVRRIHLWYNRYIVIKKEGKSDGRNERERKETEEGEG